MNQSDQQRKIEALDLDRYVPALLGFIANKLSAGASICYRKNFGVGIVEWRMLSMLAVENGITANRICQVTGIDKGAVSRAIRMLESSGHVVSEVDPEDARRYNVSLTTRGQNLHDQVLRAALEREKLLLGEFTPEEIDTLIDFLGRMHKRVNLVNQYDPSES